MEIKITPETYRYIRYQVFRKKRSLQAVKDSLIAQGMDSFHAQQSVDIVFQTEREKLKKRAGLNLSIGIFLLLVAISVFIWLIYSLTESERWIAKSIFIALTLLGVLGGSITIKGVKHLKK